MVNDEALNASEVASILHVGRNAVYELAKSGALPSYRIGRKLLFALRDVEAYLAAQRTGGPAAAGVQGAPRGLAADAEAAIEGRLGEGEGAFALGGSGTAVDLIAERLAGAGLPVVRAPLTSYGSLRALYQGQAAAAVVHLYDQRTNSYNVPYVQRLAPGTPVAVFRLVRRRQGLVVAAGNPKGLASWGALLRPGVRLANRVRGCGSRVLLDEKLLSMEARGEAIEGYGREHGSGLQAAQAVAGGAADVTVAGAQVAAQVEGVELVALQEEWLDLVVAKREGSHGLLRAVRAMLADRAFEAEYARITQGDPASFGSIVYEC